MRPSAHGTGDAIFNVRLNTLSLRRRISTRQSPEIKFYCLPLCLICPLRSYMEESLHIGISGIGIKGLL